MYSGDNVISKAVATRRVPDIQFRSLHIGKSYANLITKTKLTLIHVAYSD